MESRKSSSKENKNIVRKSIIRYPEVPQNNEQPKNAKIAPINGPECSKKSENAEQKTSRKSLHEPTVNKLADWRKALEELKDYKLRSITGKNDISKTSQDFINRAVSPLNI